jgi:hypothetical protein
VVVQPILELKIEERRSLRVSWKKKNKSGTGATLWRTTKSSSSTCCWWFLLLVDRSQNVNLSDVGQGMDALRGSVLVIARGVTWQRGMHRDNNVAVLTLSVCEATPREKRTPQSFPIAS